jgi:hypothetical protein
VEVNDKVLGRKFGLKVEKEREVQGKTAKGSFLNCFLDFDGLGMEHAWDG